MRYFAINILYPKPNIYPIFDRNYSLRYMKILYYDCFSGISGDMNLGAMIDLGVDPAYLISELEKLQLDGYSLSFITDQRKGITGTRAIVKLTNPSHSQSNGPSANNIAAFPKTFESGKFQINHTHGNEHGRNFADIKLIIENSSLSDKVQSLSLDIFTRVAVAEAKIHGKSIDEVHFHEVGAIDSIVDIIGAAICIDFLKPDKIMCSPLELGGGMVKCAHGTFPVPAPATAEILKNIPVKMGAVGVETTTPTGAAIIAALATEYTEKPNFTISKIGYGIGYRDNLIPNVVRVLWAEDTSTKNKFDIALADVIECNIDDMNPELYEYIMDKLFEAGADDVYFQPIVMKKSRPAITLSVLCKTTLTPVIEHILLTETSSLGIRKYTVEKKMLQREWETVSTQWGPIRIKYGILEGKRIKMKPEYEDCITIARINNITMQDILQEIQKIINK
jgi:pyridinium-3,5-bisthiocarboxylic acid mononucleotide nickel chelatase